MRTDRNAFSGFSARHCLAATLFAFASLSWLAGAPAAARAGSDSARQLERSVKAAFLYKFLSYTEFPATAFADASAPVVIGVVGADAMAAELSRIVAGRTVGTRPIAVRTLKEGEAPEGVHLLFLGASATSSTGKLLRAAQQPMLVVTEADNGLAYGSMINFRIIDQRVRFDVSLEAVDKHNIKLSSRLLTVANQVYKGGG
jgi:hypothetical protein